MYTRFGKRTCDTLLACAIIVLLSPLFATAAVAVWLDDGRPILFRQVRVGRDGLPFIIWKFRTMPVGTRHVPSAALHMPTVTKVGRILRRSNVDELPQLLNVLRGEMSVVGPRPALRAQVEVIEARRTAGCYALRPGLTGLAQVRAYDDMPDLEKVAHDAEYARTVGPVVDVLILARTFLYLFRSPPVY